METIKFTQSNQMLFLGFLWIFIVASLVCSLFMILTLVRKGDERKEYLVKNSAYSALRVGLIFLVLTIIWNVFLVQFTHFAIETSLIIFIGIISIAFSISYLINMKRHG